MNRQIGISISSTFVSDDGISSHSFHIPRAKEHLEVVNDLTPIHNNWLKSEEFDKTMYFHKLEMILRLISQLPFMSLLNIFSKWTPSIYI